MKLFFDINNVVNRVYYGYNVYGHNDKFNDLIKHSVFKIIETLKEKYKVENKDIYGCFDSYGDGRSWRYDYFNDYKTGRTRNEAVHEMIDYFYKNLENIGVNTYKIDRAESDDIIAILSKKYHPEECIVISNDNDMVQLLLDGNVKIFDTKASDFRNIENPQLEYFKKLFTGDNSDAIKSVVFDIEPKIQFGEKTFETLFQSIDSNGDYETTKELIIEELIKKYEKKKVKNLEEIKEKLIKNISLNELLTNFSSIPTEIVDKIIDFDTNYTNNNYNPSFYKENGFNQLAGTVKEEEKKEDSIKISTSYYAQLPKLAKDENNLLVSISSSIPSFVDTSKLISLKSLAPTWDILNEYKKEPNEERYLQRFNEEVLSKVNLKEIVENLVKEHPGKNIVFMCYEKPSDFCHRQEIANHCEKIFGIEVKEMFNESLVRENHKMVSPSFDIKEFKKENDFLSNMALGVNFNENGIVYPSVEHYYVAMKVDPTLTIEGKNVHEYIATMESPYEAKKLGQKLPLNKEWSDEYKLKVMKKALEYKFSLPAFKEKLLATGNKKLEEGNYWNDTFWGVSLKDGSGENHLGKMIMAIRKSLQEDKIVDKIISSGKHSPEKIAKFSLELKNPTKHYLAITGHTQIEKGFEKTPYSDGSYEYDSYLQCKASIKNAVEDYCKKAKIDKKNLVLISGAARGADEIFAHVGMEMGLDIVLAVPHTVEWHKTRGPSTGNTHVQMIEYDMVLDYITKKGGDSHIYEIPKYYNGNTYKYVNFARNDFMVHLCDSMFSYKVYESTGTNHAIECATKNDKYCGNYDTIIVETLKKEKKREMFDIMFNTDVFNSGSHVIAQGCNCFCVQGAGIAKYISSTYPNVYAADLATEKGDRKKLGTFTYADVNPDNEKGKVKYIANLYTQYTYNDRSDMFYIKAFEESLKKMITHFCDERDSKGKEKMTIKFGIPAIGLGLANGDIHEIYTVLQKINVEFRNKNVELNLCLHPKDVELNKEFKKLHLKEKDYVDVEKPFT